MASHEDEPDLVDIEIVEAATAPCEERRPQVGENLQAKQVELESQELFNGARTPNFEYQALLIESLKDTIARKHRRHPSQGKMRKSQPLNQPLLQASRPSRSLRRSPSTASTRMSMMRRIDHSFREVRLDGRNG